MTQVVSGSLTAQFEYNGLGDRTRQWVNGVETQYLLDPVGLTQVLAESTGGQATHYLPGLAQYSNNAWAYQLPDPLASVRQLVDAQNEVLLAQSYDPFGNVIQRSAVGSQRSLFGYTGQQVDSTGLVYLRARYYDSLTGRFISQDPFADPTLGNIVPPIFAFPLDKGNLRWQNLIAPSQFNRYSAITDLAKTRTSDAHLPPAEPKLNRQWR